MLASADRMPGIAIARTESVTRILDHHKPGIFGESVKRRRIIHAPGQMNRKNAFHLLTAAAGQSLFGVGHPHETG